MKTCNKLASLSIKYKVIVPVVVMLLLSCFVAGVTVYDSISASDEQEIRDTLVNLQSVVARKIDEEETVAGLLTDNLAHNNDVQFSVALKDPGLLKQNSAPIIKTLEQGSFIKGYFDFTDPNGKVIYASAEQWLIGKNLAEARPLLKKVIQEHKKVTGLEAGPDGLFVRTISPVIYNAQFSGAIEFNVSLKSIFQKVKEGVNNIEIALLIPAELLPQRERNAVSDPGKMTFAYATNPAVFKEAEEYIRADTKHSDIRHGERIFHFFPIELADTNSNVTAVIAYDCSARAAAIQGAMQKLWLILGISTLLIVIAMIIFLSHIIAPVKKLVTGMRALSRGQFTSPVPPTACDELGTLGRLSNNILFSFGRLILTVRQDAENLTTAAGFIKSSGSKFREGISELDRESDKLATKSEQVSQHFQNTSHAMEDLTTASSEIASSVSTSAASASETLEVAIDANEVIKSLGENSQKIGEIVKVIDAVARQTNLLALNATIEAARAGEAGKGFAVVANEVKELAKQTGEATDEIARMIEAIQADTSRAVKAVDDIANKVQNVSDMTNTIASATEEQTATINEISGTLEAGMQDVMGLAEMAESLKAATLRFSENVVRTTGSQEAIVELADELQTVARYFDVSEEAIAAAGIDIDEKVKLLSVTLQHFRWKQALTLAILSGEPADIEHNADNCPVGKFVSDRLKVAGPDERGLMQAISQHHQELHRLGHETMKMLQQGRHSEARTVFKEELRPLFAKMLELLEQAKSIAMQHTVSANQA